MFRETRRKDRVMPAEEAEALLREQDYGVLCVSGDDGYPYGVPVNYGYADGKIYIHSTAQDSHKLDGLRRSDKVSFTVVGQHDVVPEVFSSNYSSVIVFGRARIIPDGPELPAALQRMMTGLAPDMADAAMEHCRNSINAMVMLEITPEYISGKARRQK
ncbi:MAG: pyridoxamine 5'-phosphate oxidase family protein [Oscillospiraceae bacterium]